MSKENLSNKIYDEFLYSVQNLIESKYLLIDRRVSELLQSIASNERVYNLIAECMVNFDFIAEWQNAIRGNRLVLPEDSVKKISFIFCMLNNIDDKNLDLTKVMEHYFSYDASKTAYAHFCEDIIIEFRNLIMKKLGISFNDADKEEDNLLIEEEQKLEENLILVLRKLSDYVNFSKKVKLINISRDDLVAVISTFEFAVRNSQIEYYYALSVTIKNALKKAREVLQLVQEMDNLSSKLIQRS